MNSKLIKIYLVFASLFIFNNYFSQKIGIVDTDYILNKLPEYLDSKQRLEAQIDTWQKEIKALQSEYEQKKSAFESEKVLLIGEQLKIREKEVIDLEKSIKNTISLRFGKTGEIATLRENLTKPFQDKIWDAIKTIQEKFAIGILFDKNQMNVLIVQEKFDYTEKVLDILTKKEKPKKGKNKEIKEKE